MDEGATDLQPTVPNSDAPSQHEPGAKLDTGKIDLSLLLLFARALREVARVGDYGQRKYTRGGFLKVPEGRRRYAAAMFRHEFEAATGKVYDEDPWYDTEAGSEFKGKVLHEAQTAWNALAKLEILLREQEGVE